MSQPIHERPVDILRTLIRFDTTNPPGNEAECIHYIRDLLESAGFTTTLLAKTPSRPNLVTRLPGRGDAPPLLLQGHVDVVTTENQHWTHDPFGAELVDGEVWGRGALDMKGGVAMMLAALLRARAAGLQPAGDIILCVLADEEAASDYGARFVVEQHPEHFEGVRYAIGEGGGAAQTILGQRFYPIMVAEKQVCWMKATLRGPGGHGSLPLRGGAMARLGQALIALDQNRLPVHLTPVARQMIGAMAEALPSPTAATLAALLDPAQTDAALDAMSAQGIGMARTLDALLHNTVNATVVRGGHKTNVIPSQIELELDGRVLPGYTAADIQAEVKALLGDDLELAVIRHDPGLTEPDLSLVPLLADLVREADPGGVPIPSMVGGFTDGRMFARLGIQNYGFLPQNLPAEYSSLSLVHGADERAPVEAIEFGARVLYRLLERYRG
ncbi:MAG TPA: M20/M25/M40 family metallo-hydrolase [Caldilineaceae bacterium]|nr:M20/M25/M40 family metallo-hydrolase [Caldilineaceae bacterium]